MTETIVEFGDDVLAHQFQDNQHRLVLCHRPPPQEVGEWVGKDETCTVTGYSATWDKVEQCQ